MRNQFHHKLKDQDGDGSKMQHSQQKIIFTSFFTSELILTYFTFTYNLIEFF
jgi:hypothetical protein